MSGLLAVFPSVCLAFCLSAWLILCPSGFQSGCVSVSLTACPCNLYSYFRLFFFSNRCNKDGGADWSKRLVVCHTNRIRHIVKSLDRASSVNWRIFYSDTNHQSFQNAHCYSSTQASSIRCSCIESTAKCDCKTGKESCFRHVYCCYGTTNLICSFKCRKIASVVKFPKFNISLFISMGFVCFFREFVCESCYLFLAKQRTQDCNEINCVLLNQGETFYFKILLTVSDNRRNVRQCAEVQGRF